jgi:bifunctional non-homologous end joining protein LigD
MGIAKRDLVDYYAQISEWILPHVVNRPLSLVRCPQGQGGQCFFQKHAVAGTPTAVERVTIREKTKESPYLFVRGIAGLLSLVQVGVLEIHPWGSTLENIEKPDRLVFDLDPGPDVSWASVVSAAKELQRRLQDLGLESFPKITGGKGLHLVVPIQPLHEWPEAKRFCQMVAGQLAADDPAKYTANMSKARRQGRIYIDYLRNDRGATAIAPYSTRKLPGAPVAVPLLWKEVSSRTRSDHFNVKTLPSRLRSRTEDPWAALPTLEQSLTARAWQQLGRAAKSV